MDSGAEKDGRIRRAVYCLYVSHFLSSWGDRMWEFALALLFMQIWSDSLLLVALYGLIASASVALLGLFVGNWVDLYPRRPLVITALVVQNSAVVLTAVGVMLLLLLPSLSQGGASGDHPFSLKSGLPPKKQGASLQFGLDALPYKTGLNWDRQYLQMASGNASNQQYAEAVEWRQAPIPDMHSHWGQSWEFLLLPAYLNPESGSILGTGILLALGEWRSSVSEPLQTSVPIVSPALKGVPEVDPRRVLAQEEGPILDGQVATSGSHVGFFALVLLINAVAGVGALADLAMNVAVERDWVVVVAQESSDSGQLARINAGMRQIDLVCKLVAPSAVGLLMSVVDAFTAALIVTLWNVATAFVEYWLLVTAYRAVPALAHKLVPGVSPGKKMINEASDEGYEDLPHGGGGLGSGNVGTGTADLQTQEEGFLPVSTPTGDSEEWRRGVLVADGDGIRGQLSSTESESRMEETEEEAVGGSGDTLHRDWGIETSLGADKVTVQVGNNQTKLDRPCDSRPLSVDKQGEEICEEERPNEKRGPEEEEEERAKWHQLRPSPTLILSPLRAFQDRLREVATGWRIYLRQETLLPSLSLACLYLTVLSFGALMTAELSWKGVPAALLGLARGISALTGIVGTLIFPILQKRMGTPTTALLAIWSQWGFLLLCVAGVFFRGAVSSALLIFGVIFSRVGLWMFDLAVVQLVQTSVPETERGIVGGVQGSIQQFFFMLVYVAAIIVPHPEDFWILVVISFGMVSVAALLFSKHANSGQRYSSHAELLLPK